MTSSPDLDPRRDRRHRRAGGVEAYVERFDSFAAVYESTAQVIEGVRSDASPDEDLTPVTGCRDQRVRGGGRAAVGRGGAARTQTGAAGHPGQCAAGRRGGASRSRRAVRRGAATGGSAVAGCRAPPAARVHARLRPRSRSASKPRAAAKPDAKRRSGREESNDSRRYRAARFAAQSGRRAGDQPDAHLRHRRHAATRGRQRTRRAAARSRDARQRSLGIVGAVGAHDQRDPREHHEGPHGADRPGVRPLSADGARSGQGARQGDPARDRRRRDGSRQDDRRRGRRAADAPGPQLRRPRDRAAGRARGARQTAPRHDQAATRTTKAIRSSSRSPTTAAGSTCSASATRRCGMGVIDEAATAERPRDHRADLHARAFRPPSRSPTSPAAASGWTW